MIDRPGLRDAGDRAAADSKIPVSVIVLTKDEQAGIATTLDRLGDFDQIIVVDSNSTDATTKIARRKGAAVINFTWDGKYPKKKQWSLQNAGASHDWVLLLDADEYPTPGLIREIRSLCPELAARKRAAYEITLRYRFAGRFLTHGHRVTKRSLLDATRTTFPEIDDLNAPGIREVEGHYQPQTSGEIGRLRCRLVHDDVDPVSSWFDRHNRYSDWEAHLRMNRAARQEVAGKRTSRGRFFNSVPFKPAAFFVYSYLVRGGFLDGRAGLDYALALSMYYWQIGLKSRELQRGLPSAAARQRVGPQ